MRSKLEMEALYSYSQCLLREYLVPKMQSAERPKIDVFDTDGEEMDIWLEKWETSYSCKFLKDRNCKISKVSQYS